jgi:hypothetical protein
MTGFGFSLSGKGRLHFLQFFRSVKLNVPQCSHCNGLGFGGLQPPQ